MRFSASSFSHKIFRFSGKLTFLLRVVKIVDLCFGKRFVGFFNFMLLAIQTFGAAKANDTIDFVHILNIEFFEIPFFVFVLCDSNFKHTVLDFLLHVLEFFGQFVYCVVYFYSSISYILVFFVDDVLLGL